MDDKVNILLVDDEPAGLVTLEAILAPLGQNLVYVRSGRDALRQLLDRDFAVILLDVQMPDLDGFETATLIRAREHNKDVPIIFLTAGQKSEANVFLGYTVGAVDYLFKPLEPTILRSKVAMFVELTRKTELIRRQAEELRGREREARQLADSRAQLLSVLEQQNRDLEAFANEVRRTEEKFRAVAETASDAIVSADQQGNVIYVNPSVEHLFGYATAELVGQSLTRLMPERFQPAHLSGFRRYLAGGPAHVVGKGIVELAGRRKDGSEFPLELSLAEWRAQGERHFTAIIRDITARREIEDHVRALNEELLQRATELADANQELEAFSYSVSHDLRAPLRSIDGYSRVLLSEHSAALDADARDCLDRVRRATKRMGQLIDDLLKLSHVARTELRREDVDVSALAQEIIETLRLQEPHRNVHVDLTPGLTTRGDAGLLRIALENLLGNAWKFSARRPDAHIEFGTTVEKGESIYFVRDNGAGFDMEYAQKLFSPFQRMHTVDEFSGTGIGLATVQRIVRKHGGRIWAQAAVDHGAAFYFTFAMPDMSNAGRANGNARPASMAKDEVESS